jgi:hypothetical protein
VGAFDHLAGVRWDDSVPTDLNTLLVNGAGWQVTSTLGINENSAIICLGELDGETRGCSLSNSTFPEAAICVSLSRFVLLLSDRFDTCLHIKQQLFNKFYALCHSEYGINSIFQCLKGILCIERVLFIVFKVIIFLHNQILQLLIHTQIKRSNTSSHALVPFKGIAY